MTTVPAPGEGAGPHPNDPTNAAAPPPAPSPPPFAPPSTSTVNTENQRLDDGVNRCPRCGSTDIQLRSSAGMLVCLFCRHEWNEARLDESVETGDIASLTGTVIGSGAADIVAGADEVVTLKCGGCGAEVVVNTAEQMGARCHWCRHVLTINEQVPNGAVPDAVLPFTVTHEQAVATITEFAGKRRLFADRRFLRDFAPGNIVGVYMPYMVIDANASADTVGFGEIQTRRYTRGSGDNAQTYYDADVYSITRHIDFTTDDLTIEASAERANMNTATNTNNVINTILPFDTQNAVKWNANYLSGFTSEKRDQNVSNTVPEFESQLLSIARAHLVPSVERYDRGVRWEQERIEVHGSRWLAMCLPVWLYSYYSVKGGSGMVHYIAVNGRTGEVMGSIPVSRPRLLAAAITAGTLLEGLVIAFLAASR
ncbi:MAG: TFIIB-type zinc ribbon-containing protein [Microthrixaceae bacterium]